MPATPGTRPRLSQSIRASLTARFLNDSPVAELAHVALGLTVTLLLIGIYNPAPLALWFASLVATSGIRFRVRRRFAQRDPAPTAIPAAVIVSIVAVGLTWSAGAAPLIHSAPVETLGFVMIVECGLAAAATATFVVSLPAFHAFLLSIFIPLVAGILGRGLTRGTLTGALLVVVFWATMAALHKRGHDALARSLDLQLELERSRAAALNQQLAAEAATTEVRESEQRLFQLVETMPVGVIVIDARGELYYGNKAAQLIGGPGLRGNPSAEDLRQIYPVYMPGTNEAYPREKLPAGRALNGESVVEQYEVEGPTGRRLIEARGTPIRDRTGAVAFGVAVLSDTSETQLGEARRAALNAVLQITADATSEAGLLDAVLPVLNDRFDFALSEMWLVDPEIGVVRRMGSSQRGDDARIAAFDRTSAPLILQPGVGLAGSVWKTSAPIWRNRLIADNTMFTRKGEAVAAGLRTAVAVPIFVAGAINGVLVLFSTEARDPDGPITDTLMAIGAQVGGSIGRRRADAVLRATEERYRQLVEASTDLVWEIGLDERWRFLNAASRRIYGAPPEDLIGKPLSERSDPESLAADRAIMARLVQGEVIHEYETVHRTVTGAKVVISTSAAPLRAPSGEIIGFHGIARDAGERAAARDALQAARDAAEQIASAKSAFLANMSHEIRTPMNGVLGVTELLLETNLDAEQRRAVDLIATSGRSLMDVINEILDFSKIEANQLEIESTEFDLHALVESTVKIAAAAMTEHVVEVITDINADVSVHVRGDPTRLRQVLANLMGNAVKFTHQGEIVVSVERVIGGADRGKLCFAVRDTGIGMSSETMTAIFEPFRQADSSTTRRYGGTGLGLSISRRLVELMGGSLDVASEAGSGSTFSFTLPLEAVRAPAAPPDVTLNGVKVLVVDDNATNQRVIGGMLSAAGCVVDAANNATSALAMLRTAAAEGQPYRALISDVQMPDVDGFEFIRRVRANSMLTQLPVVLATSGSRRGDLAMSESLGIAAYLLKPISRGELARALRSALGGPKSAQPPSPRKSIQVSIRPPLKILVAEDNPINQEVAKAMLTRRGHEVDVANDGRAAVRAALATEYDVILMDIQMPELDGLDAAREIRAGRTVSHTRIVALTANALDGERERCLAGGMDAYLAKPFIAADLFAVVEAER